MCGTWRRVIEQAPEFIDLYDSLFLVLPERGRFEPILVGDIANAYNLKRQFALKAGELILGSYADVVERQHIPKRPFHDPTDFDFWDPVVQLAYWTDSLLHNCRGALETLGHILNYVYDLGLKEKEVAFYRVCNAAQDLAVGIRGILSDIQNDDWFRMVNSLRNRSYHVVVNTFTPRFVLGSPASVRYDIHFPVDRSKSNMRAFESLEEELNITEAKMELAEFSHFLTFRLQEYLSQVDGVIANDCLDIAEGRTARSESALPRLVISGMNLRSWSPVVQVSDLRSSEVADGADLD